MDLDLEELYFSILVYIYKNNGCTLMDVEKEFQIEKKMALRLIRAMRSGG